MTDNSVSNPGTRRTTGRRRNLNKIWSGTEWKEQKAAFLKDYPNCEMHKSVIINGNPLIVPATVPHHPFKTSYKEGYSDLELSQCVAYCKNCHFAVHHGMKLCPVCGEHYCPWDAPMCKRCFDKTHPEIVAQREQKKEEFETKQREIKRGKATKRRVAAKKHPCRFHGVNQKCRIGGACEHSPTKAERNCKRGFEKKKRLVKK